MGTTDNAVNTSLSGTIQEPFFWVCFILSALVMAGAVFWSVKRWINRSARKYTLTGLRIMTLGTFISCMLIHFPFHCHGVFPLDFHNVFVFKNLYTLFGSFFMSIHSTLQTFVLESSFSDRLKDIAAFGDSLNGLIVCYTFWVVALFILAPILTLSNILSLFNAYLSELRIRINKHKALYVFSELNPQSIAIARSIAKKYNESKKNKRSSAHNDKQNSTEKPRKPLFVFTDCFLKDDELDQDLMQAAHSLRAVCVKKDITHLKLTKDKYPIEFFIIGADESENMEQTIKLNEDYKDSPICSVYLYSAKPNAGYILDSIDKGNHTITSRSFTESDAKAFLENEKTANKAYSVNESYYYIRRVNVVDTFTIKTLTDNQLMRQLSRQAKTTHFISLMIVGLGLYGTALLKNALWLYQIKGCILKICIIDSASRKSLRDRIAKEMPDIAACLVNEKKIDAKGRAEPYLHYYNDTEGDCQFDIRIYHSIDCEAARLNDMMLQQNQYKPDDNSENIISDVQAVFVALGDDNKNIETAVELRGMFDRVRHIKNSGLKKLTAEEVPLIYSIVYDNRTAENLNFEKKKKKAPAGGNNPDSGENKGIICHKGVSYHIRFIGRMSEHYHYDTIVDMKKQEVNAIYHHVEWIRNERELRKCFKTEESSIANDDTREMLHTFRLGMWIYFLIHKKAKETWNDSFYYISYKNNKEKAVKRTVKRKAGAKKKLGYMKKWLNVLEIEKTIQSYDRFEYFRDSSVAKETYCKKVRDKYFADYFRTVFNDPRHITDERYVKICTCDKCIAIRESEHMRWNAYMRVKGYRYNKDRNDRAKTHDLLKAWNDLPLPDRYKD